MDLIFINLAVFVLLLVIKFGLYRSLKKEKGLPVHFRFFEWYTEDNQNFTTSRRKRRYMQQANTISVLLGLLIIATIIIGFKLVDEMASIQ